jgi:8-oxo-dGTP diphosphatase
MTVYRNPTPTVDILIELDGQPGTLVFIKRNNAPIGFALPGGFVDVGEFLADAAAREAKEETGLDIELIELFHCYSNPTRDPRQHTTSTVFIARAAGQPVAGDDADRCVVADPTDMFTSLVFDHALIVKDYLHYKQTGQRPPARR